MGTQLAPSSPDQTAPAGPTATMVGRRAPGTQTPPHTPVRSGGRVRATHVAPPSLGTAARRSPSCTAYPPPSTKRFGSSRKPIDGGPEAARVVVGSVSTVHVPP